MRSLEQSGYIMGYYKVCLSLYFPMAKIQQFLHTDCRIVFGFIHLKHKELSSTKKKEFSRYENSRRKVRQGYGVHYRCKDTFAHTIGCMILWHATVSVLRDHRESQWLYQGIGLPLPRDIAHIFGVSYISMFVHISCLRSDGEKKPYMV